MKKLPYEMDTIVISTRIRLARNLTGYPFPEKLTEELADKIIQSVRYELNRLDEFNEYNIGEIQEEKATLLQEKHLISPALIRRKEMAAAFISSDEDISVMVNEEDHLREQYIIKGFELVKAYERIAGIDESIGQSLPFAYDERLGYLTACPSNLGTGMRASVMLFLPGLTKYDTLQELLPKLKAGGMTVRGVFGEGSTAEGYLYQVSNERTLGVSEKEILRLTEYWVTELCSLEHRARERMLKEEGLALRDTCLRSFGILTNCALLPEKEFEKEIMKIRLGLALGFFKTNDIFAFNRFVEYMRPASFTLENCPKGADELTKNTIRAEVTQNVLRELVFRVD